MAQIRRDIVFQIHFLNDFYYANCSVTNTFYLNVYNQCFPDDQWSDFAITVLYGWTTKIIENYHSKTSKFTLFFMDGPYYVECSKQGSIVHMVFIEDKKRKTKIFECDVEIDLIIRELRNASINLIKALKKHGFGKLEDMEELGKSIKFLETL